MNDYEREHLGKIRPYLAECTVLLKYGGQFPIDGPCSVALYGSGARNTIKGGTGSGEVNSRFFVNIEQGLKDRGFTVTSGAWLDRYDVIRASARKRFVKEIKARARKKHVLAVMESMGAIMQEPEYDIPLNAKGDIAVYVVSRISGEGSDRSYVKGDILLTDSEVRDILALNASFDRFLLVLNTGGLVDLTPVAEVRNILLLSQLGVETGYVLSDIILGNNYPSGKLATTWGTEGDYCREGEFGLRDDTHYKEGVYVGYRYFDTVGKKPVFPFGFGLGYTSFDISEQSFALSGQKVSVNATVKNVGRHSGKETLQLYVSVPDGEIDQPYQMLAAFSKTPELKPGSSCEVSLSFDMKDIASYLTKDASYVLESGDYILRLGTSSRDTEIVGAVRIDETIVVKKAKNVLGDPGFEDMKPSKVDPALPGTFKKLALDPASISCDVVRYGTSEDIDTSVARELTDEELIYLAIGSFNPSAGALSVIGNESINVAGAAGQTTHMLRDKGIRSHIMADGPAGVRLSREFFMRDGKVMTTELPLPETMQEFLPALAKLFLKLQVKKPRAGEEIKYQYCTALPIGTAIAQSWNQDLAYTLGDIAGSEMEMFGVDLWLAPALNIHRDIRCGRNFEYFSEDPLISGIMAAGITNGVQSHKGRGTTIKHYAANNQETNRYRSNSCVSERAMREIYLKGFEICVRSSSPKAVMTSYNLLNEIHTAENRGLIEDILRDEYGFKGIVMTDWVVSSNNFDKDSVYRDSDAGNVVKAGGDVFMPGCQSDYDSVRGALSAGMITRHQLEINATRIINL